jgi:hypothetical protein
MTARPVPSIAAQSVSELYSYFETAHRALGAVSGGFDADARRQHFSKCRLYAGRVARAQANSTSEILMKIEAAEWLEMPPGELLASIRDDLYRIKLAASAE